MFFIVSQIIGFIAFLFSLVAYHQNKKNNILGNMVISNILNLTHYLLLGAITGGITKIIAIFRDLFIILKDKYKIKSYIPLLMFIIIYIFVGFYLYTDIYSVFPIIAAVVYLIPVWFGKEKMIKIAALLGELLWLYYNIVVFSIVGIASKVISIISLILAIRNEFIRRENNVDIK